MLLIKQQLPYFKFLQESTHINVKFIAYLDLESTIKKVKTAIQEVKLNQKNDLEEFQKIKVWPKKL